MSIRDSWRDPILINTVGHWAGVLLFSVTILLLVRNWRLHGIKSVKLPLIAAGLALGWNLGSLFILGWPLASPVLLATVVAASFSMLTMLPAVLLQVVNRGQHRIITGLGYGLSIAGMSLHVTELLSTNGHLHQIALLVVAVGFGGLSVAALVADCFLAAKPDRSQCVSLICLFLFTSSFVHFGYHHTSSPWAAEITWHHIGVPVALIVLLKDYRFLLLDTFSRFLVNFGLSVIYAGVLLALTVELRLWDMIRSSMFAAGGVLVALCVSLILFSQCRNAVQAWMNKVIFRRGSIATCKQAIELAASSVRSEDDLIAQSARHIAEYFRTDQFVVSDLPSSDAIQVSAEALQGANAGYAFRPEVRIPLHFSAGNNRLLYLGRRRGGQPYWSDDFLDLGQLGMVVVEQVERFRAEELKRLVDRAELKALQAQINPHFLFNALNTLYGTIDRGSTEARSMVLNLADIFRYFLQGERAYISLADELRIVEAYLQIEGLRLGNRLSSEVLATEKSRSTMIPILTVQPLVENAIKHGVTPKAGPCRVVVKAEDVAGGLRITVQDTGVGFGTKQKPPSGGIGIGLDNVRRRLVLSCGPAAELQIRTSEGGTTVSFLVPYGIANHVSSTQVSRVPA
jgi:two-component sensor histidine kinase